MADWIRLFKDVDYTISGDTLTLSSFTPVDDSVFVFHYSYADGSAVGGHQHAVEQRTGTWNGGQSWSLGHRPDGGEKKLQRKIATGLVWQFTSDFHAVTNQVLRLYELSGPDTALTWSQSDAWSAPSERVYCVQSLTSNHCFFGTHNGTTGKLYRFDRSDGTFNVIFSQVAAALPWQIYMVSESDMYIVMARGNGAGIWHTANGGTNWTQFTNPPFSLGFAQGFQEAPNQSYAITVVGSRIWNLHTGFNTGTGFFWNIDFSDNAGVTWSGWTGTIVAFSKGSRGFLFARNGHLPYIAESFLSFASGDVGSFSNIDTGAGDASAMWMAAFSDGTILTRGGTTTRLSTDYGLVWANAPTAAPAYSAPTDVMHLTNVLLSRDWLIVPDWGDQVQNITTDKGTTWQTLALPNYCGLAAFVGGVG